MIIVLVNKVQSESSFSSFQPLVTGSADSDLANTLHLQVDYLIWVNTYSNCPHSDEMESNEVETHGSTAVTSYHRFIYLQKTEKKNKTWLRW